MLIMQMDDGDVDVVDGECQDDGRTLDHTSKSGKAAIVSSGRKKRKRKHKWEVWVRKAVGTHGKNDDAGRLPGDGRRFLHAKPSGGRRERSNPRCGCRSELNWMWSFPFRTPGLPPTFNLGPCLKPFPVLAYPSSFSSGRFLFGVRPSVAASTSRPGSLGMGCHLSSLGLANCFAVTTSFWKISHWTDGNITHHHLSSATQ